MVVPFQLRSDGVDLCLLNMVATFGTAVDVTAGEVVIESFYPADERHGSPHRAGRGLIDRSLAQAYLDRLGAGLGADGQADDLPGFFGLDHFGQGGSGGRRLPVDGGYDVPARPGRHWRRGCLGPRRRPRPRGFRWASRLWG